MTDAISPMQQELLNRADAIFNSIGAAISKTSDLVMEGGKAVVDQLPDIAMQYITYGRAYNTWCILFGAALIVLVCMLTYKMFVSPKPIYEIPSGVYVISACITLISLCVGLITFLSHVSPFLMVWFAPKIWLIKEIANLVRTVKS